MHKAQQWEPWTTAFPPGLVRFVDKASAASAVPPSLFSAVETNDGHKNFRELLDAKPPAIEVIVAALYERLGRLGIAYNTELTSTVYNDEKQEIRSPEQVVRLRSGTCVDLALLFAGLCMQADLLPLIVLLEEPGTPHRHVLTVIDAEHEFIQWDESRNWPQRARQEGHYGDTGLKSPWQEDAHLAALLDKGVYIAVECTGFSHMTGVSWDFPASKPPFLSFAASREEARNRLRGMRHVATLDVVRMQKSKSLSPFAPPEQRFAGFHESVDEPWLAQLRTNFVGRKQVFGQVRNWLDNPNSPAYLIIEAPAGHGKSSLMAKLVEAHSDWCYFFLRDEGEHNSASRMLRSLCQQLASKLGVVATLGSGDVLALEDEFYRLRRQLLLTLEPGQTLVIALDGLDEGRQSGPEQILRPQLFQTVFSGLRFVLSFRTGAIDPEHDLGITGSFTPLQLRGLDSTDIASLFDLLGRPDLAKEGALTDKIVQVTNGEPFYLRFLVEDLATQPGMRAIPDQMPKNANTYIRSQVRNLSRKLFDSVPAALNPSQGKAAGVASSILLVLSSAHDWITREELIEMLPDEGLLIGALIPALRRYFVTERPRGSLNEREERYLVTPLRLRDALRETYSANDQRTAKKLLLDYCRSCRENKSRYAYGYLTRHLFDALESARKNGLSDEGKLYVELLGTVDKPFLDEKAAVCDGIQAVLPDLERALEASLSADSAGDVLRMVLLAANYRTHLLRYAINGGIGSLVAEGAFEEAASLARGITDHEIRFGQLCAVAEAAIKAGSRLGLTLIDETLRLATRYGSVDPDLFHPLIKALLGIARSPVHAQKLARKLEMEIDNDIAEVAELLLPTDDAYSMQLLSLIDQDHRWGSVLLSVAEANVAEDESLAKVLAMRVVTHARRSSNHYQLIAALRVMLRIDKSDLKQHIEFVLEFAGRRLSESATDRGAGILYNDATLVLAGVDLEAGMQLALAQCPEVVDANYTKTSTLTHVLTLSMEAGIPLDLAKFPLSDISSTRALLYGAHVDDYLGALAVCYWLQNDFATSEVLYFQIDTLSARAAVHVLEASYGLPSDEAKLIAAFKGLSAHSGLGEYALRRFVFSKPNDTLSYVDSISDHDSRLDLYRLILKAAPHLADELAGRMHAAARQISDGSTLYKLLSTAEDLVTISPETARRALKDAFLASQLDQDNADVGTLIRCAIRIGSVDVAQDAIRQAVATAKPCDSNRRRSLQEEVADLILTLGVPLGLDLAGMVVAEVRDLYLRTRLFSRFPSLVSSSGKLQFVRSGSLDDIYFALILCALDADDAPLAHEILNRLTDISYKAHSLLRIADTEMLTDPEVARASLSECLKLLEIGDDVHERVEGRENESETLQYRDEELAMRAVSRLAQLGRDPALLNVEAFTKWRKVIVTARTALIEPTDPARAHAALLAAREQALAMDTPLNICNALDNIASVISSTLPDEAHRLREEALKHAPAIDLLPRVVFYLEQLQVEDNIPDGLYNSIVQALENDLPGLDWTDGQCEEIFKVVRQVELKHYARDAWVNIVNALLAHERYWSRIPAIGEAGFELAKIEAFVDATMVRNILYDELGDNLDNENCDPVSLSYLASLDSIIAPDYAHIPFAAALRAIEEGLTDSPFGDSDAISALSVLSRCFEKLPSDRERRTQLTELFTCIPSINGRVDAINSLIEAALACGELEFASSLLRHLPLASAQADAAIQLAFELVSPEAPSNQTNLTDCWRSVFAAASQREDALYECASAWVSWNVLRRPEESRSAAIRSAIAVVDPAQSR